MALLVLLREKSLNWEADCHRDDGLYLSFMRWLAEQGDYVKPPLPEVVKV